MRSPFVVVISVSLPSPFGGCTAPCKYSTPLLIASRATAWTARRAMIMPLSGSLKFISGPRAVHTGANHYHIADVLPLGDLHWTKEISDRTRHQSQFRVGPHPWPSRVDRLVRSLRHWVPALYIG